MKNQKRSFDLTMEEFQKNMKLADKAIQRRRQLRIKKKRSLKLTNR